MKLFEVDEKTKEQEKNRPKFTMHLLKNIYRGVKIPWGRYILAALVGVIFYAITGGNATNTAKIASGDFSDIGVIVRYVVMTLLSLGTVAAGIMLDYASYTLNAREKSKLWKKILKLPSEFFDRESPNRVISRVTVDSDVVSVPFGMVTIILVLVAYIASIIASAGEIMKIPMAKWLLAGMAGMVILTIISIFITILAGFQISNRLAAFTSYLSERLADFGLIKASCAEEKELEEAYRLIDNRYKADMLGATATVLNTMSTYVVQLMVYIGCFGLGWTYYQKGGITGGHVFIQFNSYATGISALLAILSIVIAAFGTGAGQATVFAKLYDEPEEDNLSGEAMPGEMQDIRLDNVAFSYDGKRNVLDQISCTIPKGQVTALVGANGSGKSTLIKIIDRLYANPDGDMYIGEEKAVDVNLASWREKISIVSQNASLFSGTIRSNICYGLTDVDEAKLAKVCTLAGVDEILAKHEEGLDFEVGLGGCKLSGGEQQRVSIARAMMKDAEYLILDEATANLDTRTAKEVQKNIDELMKGKTVICIAHNYDMIKKADQILVLEAGKMIDCGSNEELLGRCEFYKQLYAAGFEV